MNKMFKPGLTDAPAQDFDIQVKEMLSECFPRRPVGRVLLVNPPESTSEMFRYAAAKRGRNSNYPSYGLLILAERLRRLGHSVSVVNLNHEVLKASRATSHEHEFDFDQVWQNLLDREVLEFLPDLIGVTCMYTMAHNSLKRVCEHLATSQIPLVIGGVHVTNDVHRVLDDIDCVRAAFLREGDLAFIDFINVLNDQAPVSELSQVILNKPTNRLSIDRVHMPTDKEIDILPAWDLSDVSEAADNGIIGTFYYLKPKGTKFASMLSNRGCRAQCTFCGVRNFNGKGVRQREVSSVLDELEHLRDNYGIQHITWLDDDLLKNEKRALALFEGMVQRNLGMSWDASNGVIAYSCTKEIVAAMEASGCNAVNIGMETGNPYMLKKIRKPGKLEKFLEAAEVFRNHEKIYCNLLLMLGFPGETMSMILDTIDVARQMDLDWNRISPLQPLPNTALYQDMVDQGLIEDVGHETSGEVRFAVGVFGTLTEQEQGIRAATPDFRKAFSSVDLDTIPSPEQINDIWFYMNYFLNFHRLYREKRAQKLVQQQKALRALADIISPENAFALYFLSLLEKREKGQTNPEVVARLERKLSESVFWSDRFSAFGLSLDDINSVDPLINIDPVKMRAREEFEKFIG